MAGTATADPPVTLTAEQAERLTHALDTSIKQQGDIQTRMNEQQEKIGKALQQMEELKKQNTDGGTELQRLRDKLDSLGQAVQSLAEQNTNLVETMRTTSRRLAQSGANEGRAFMWRAQDSRGALFESRRQAVELGYFFMATMKTDNAAKQYARKWLREQAANLAYLPNIPDGLIQHLGQHHLKVVESCMKQGLEFATQALAGGVTPGSVLTFPQFANTFIRNIEEHGAFRRNALVWPMGGDTVYIPRRKSGVSVYWVGEAGEGSYTDPDFDLLQMIAKKSMAMHKFSSELAEDENAAIALADMIMFEFSRAFAMEEDRLGFCGTGAGGNAPSGYAGFYGVLGVDRQVYAAEASEDLNKVLYVPGDTGMDRTDEITLKILRKMVGLCHTWARPGAKWYGHRTVLADLCAIETTGGGPITSVDAQGRTKLLGYPEEEVEAMPASPGTASTGVLAFGDLRKGWVLGDLRRPEVQTSEHFLFNTDQLAMRFTSRIAIKPVSPTAMVVFVTAS